MFSISFRKANGSPEERSVVATVSVVHNQATTLIGYLSYGYPFFVAPALHIVELTPNVGSLLPQIGTMDQLKDWEKHAIFLRGTTHFPVYYSGPQHSLLALSKHGQVSPYKRTNNRK